MGRLLCIAVGVALLGNHASAQISQAASAVDVASPTENAAILPAVGPAPLIPEFQPLTMSERTRKFLVGGFGPGAILRAAATGGIAQWRGTPREWGGGSVAYGERVGNA